MSTMSDSAKKQLQTSADFASMAPVEFTVVSEPWVKYKLEDQTKLFVKLVVVKIVRGLNEQGQPSYNMNTQNIIATHGAPNLRGQPSTTQLNLSDPTSYRVVASLDFDRIGDEKWNEYHLTDGTVLKTRLELSTVSRIDKYQGDGDPVYLVNTGQPLVKFKVSDQVLRTARTPVRQPDVKAPYG
jgi:hypothetical protein